MVDLSSKEGKVRKVPDYSSRERERERERGGGGGGEGGERERESLEVTKDEQPSE